MEEINQPELNRLAYLNETFELNKDNQFILSEELIKAGWKIEMSFQDKSNEKIISDEILGLKNSRYIVKGLRVKGMEHIKCLIYKEI